MADEALVDERLQRVEVRAGDLLRRLERPPPGEDAERAKRALLGRGEQVIAPLDRGPQRALPLGSISRAAGQKRQAAVEAGDQRIWIERLQPRGCELDRKRQPVEPPADLGHPLVLVLETGQHRLGALAKQLHRGRLGYRPERVLALADDVERLAARDEQLHVR